MRIALCMIFRFSPETPASFSVIGPAVEESTRIVIFSPPNAPTLATRNEAGPRELTQLKAPSCGRRFSVMSMPAATLIALTVLAPSDAFISSTTRRAPSTR